MVVDPQNQDVRFYRGEAVELDFTPTTVGTNIAGWSIRLTIVKVAGGVALVTKTVGAGITITDAPNGAYKILLADADTKPLAKGRYNADVWRTDAGSEKRLAGFTLHVVEPDYQP